MQYSYFNTHIYTYTHMHTYIYNRRTFNATVLSYGLDFKQAN